jgi:hypothetical protein
MTYTSYTNHEAMAQLDPEVRDAILARTKEWQRVAETGGDVLKAIQRTDRAHTDELITDAIKLSEAGERHWESLSAGLGRNHLPLLMSAVWNVLPDDQRRIAIGDAWTGAEYPERSLERSSWLEKFRAVGYLDDDEPAIPPEQITLWRGGVKKTRMSWTGDRERAEWFQRRYSEIGKPGKLWTVTVGPDRLLAHYHEKHRSEDEYVIDPTGLRPREA